MTMRRPALFLDRDGVINVDTGYPHRPEELVLTPTAARGIRLANDAGCVVVVATNQSGVARGMFTLADVDAFHAEIGRRIGEQAGARIDAFYVAPWHRDGIVPEWSRDHPDRKPGPGLLRRALGDWPIDAARSIMIGDKDRDARAASGAGIAAQLVPSDTCDLAAAVAAWLVKAGLRPSDA